MLNIAFKRLAAGYAFVLCLLAISGCASISQLADRTAYADKIADTSGFEKSFIKTKNFVLTAYYKLRKPSGPLTVYIEGDGLSWISRSKPSGDPTPLHPLVFRLAAADPSANIVYLARPGQYSTSENPECSFVYWTTKRFSEEVISSMNETVEQFRQKSGSKEVNLIGYSGGAAVAILIASRRDDVASIRTIAGNLDHKALGRYHNVSPLDGSLNPIDVAEAVSRIPQRHFAGENDKQIPVFITKEFAERSNDKNYSSVTAVKGADHKEGWYEQWPRLLSLPLYSINRQADR